MKAKMGSAFRIDGAVMLRLSDDDGRAVDIRLDSRSTGNVFGQSSSDGGTGAAAAPPYLQPRLSRLEMLLDLLQQMPAMEPPPHLVKQVMAQIEPARPARAIRPEPVFPGESAPSAEMRPGV
jgi:hypothetical protein